MKKLTFPSLILLAVLGSSAQAHDLSNVWPSSRQDSAKEQQLIALDGPPSRYEVAVENARQLDKSPLDKNSLDILMSLVREFNGELRRLDEKLKSTPCTRTIIIEKLFEPVRMQDQVRTTFLRRKVEK
ncbi:hypothetical protein EON83_11305 [bacterium]|nr:MAG: hypothetical protein EON83_11305 [bacterium]